MNYTEFIKFNNRAKEMRGSNGVVFIKDLYYLRKDITEDLCRMRTMVGDEVGEDDLPEETYSVDVEYIGFFGGGTCETLLGTLIANIIDYVYFLTFDIPNH